MTEVISVRTLFFGVYGELASGRTGSMELPGGSTVGDFIDTMRGATDFDWLHPSSNDKWQ